MMIFSKKLRQDTAPPTEVPSPYEDDQRHLPDAWRVVLEDGTTSDHAPPTQGATGAGRKLLEELTEALDGRAKRKEGPSRPRNIAMPLSPPQPLVGLDDRLQAPTTPTGASTAGPAVAAEAPGCVFSHARRSGVPGLPGCSPGPTAADQSSPILSGQSVSARGGAAEARLERVIDLWPRLPRGIQIAVLAMIEVEASDAC